MHHTLSHPGCPPRNGTRPQVPLRRAGDLARPIDGHSKARRYCPGKEEDPRLGGPWVSSEARREKGLGEPVAGASLGIASRAKGTEPVDLRPAASCKLPEASVEASRRAAGRCGAAGPPVHKDPRFGVGAAAGRPGGNPRLPLRRAEQMRGSSVRRSCFSQANLPRKTKASDGTQTDMPVLADGWINFGSLANSAVRAPWLCVPTSRSVCPFGLTEDLTTGYVAASIEIDRSQLPGCQTLRRAEGGQRASRSASIWYTGQGRPATSDGSVEGWIERRECRQTQAASGGSGGPGASVGETAPGGPAEFGGPLRGEGGL